MERVGVGGHNEAMPRLLYRYMMMDVIRVAGLTAAVLVLVIAFGAAIKPLAKETLLTVGQTAKYIVLAAVPMLQFALPFAAGFAGTMSLHRMTGDNEILAASVSGISYRRLLAPIIALGLALMLVMVGLTQWVIPKFWGLLERAVTQDITALFQASIDRGEPFILGGTQIFADGLITEEDPEETGADVRLILLHVAAAQTDEEGRIDEDVTANQAVLDIYRRPERTIVNLVLSDVVGFQPGSGTLVKMEQVGPITRVIPSVLKDDARRMTRGELLALRGNPDAYGLVIERKIELAEELREVELWQAADARLREGGEVELGTRVADGQRYVVRAGGLAAGRFRPGASGVVEVVRFRGSSAELRLRSTGVVLRRESGGPLGEDTFNLQLRDCEVSDLDFPQIPNRREQVVIEDVSFTGIETSALTGRSSVALLDLAARLGDEAGGSVQVAAEKLRRERGELQREIRSRLLKRYALSATAMLLLLLGATLAMWLRDGLPLTIYLWSFLPSVVDLILISSGEHLMRDGHAWGGFTVMWSGNIVLAAFTCVAYARLARH